ncbi:MAG: transcription-repair coupling factor [Gammaproteobacteria bacterium]|nr:transcription-repair coupling factor [Gammaproteobacteria bacterium]
MIKNIDKSLSLFAPPLPATSSHTCYWPQLPHSAIALAIANAASSHEQLTVVLTANSAQIPALEQAIHFFNPSVAIHQFPDWETLPYDHFSPHQDIVSQRLKLLAQLPRLSQGILLLAISTLGQRVTPGDFIGAHALALKLGDRLPLQTLRDQLIDSGYHSVSQVERHGEFAIRGAVMDLFPMGSDYPYRIELFDDEIETLRTFDIDSQRSIDQVKSIELLPAKEFPLNEAAIALFRQQWRDRFSGNPANCSLYQAVSSGHPAAGIEYYLPLFFTTTATLFDYLPPASLLIHCDDSTSAYQTFWQTLCQRHDQLRHDISHPILPPEQLFLAENSLFSLIKNFKQIKIKSHVKNEKLVNTFNGTSLPPLQLNPHAADPCQLLKHFLNRYPQPTLFCAESSGRRERLLTLLRENDIPCQPLSDWQQFHHEYATKPGNYLTVAPLTAGVICHQPALTIISESELLGQHVSQRRRRKRASLQPEAIIRNLTELKIGDPVVHIDHGVGRYQGLETISVDDHSDDYLLIRYANDNNLYVPISSLHLISRYGGADSEHAPLHYLGSQKWQQSKRRAAQKAHDAAAELLAIYAQRHARKGYHFNFPQEEYVRFADSFPFEETVDQALAITEVIKEMCSDKTMDRLICGDVGFGKTEVAMRAAFIAAQDGKQVAMLVPTTLLAQQHYENFCDRFADWPINISLLSRFRSTSEQKKALEQLQAGKIDIIIATHRLLQRDITFSDLGLLIIDEEHRFGVRHKDRLKTLRAEVDILTLTATPIPRTLNLSLAGIRDLSLIATPPAKRLAVKTFINSSQPHLLREAVMREIMRGGQVYFLHNRVATIEKTADDLAKLIPEARIAVAHGQMRERQLEQVMTDFYHGRNNLLLCTTIIESGIDIPTANTILIDRADRFGLAQLHQLRGRVGRSHHQAYAYLLVPEVKTLKGDAKKRLEAFSALEELGIGFTLSTHDLEIRGVGEMLGEEQSGHIEEVGFTLYMSMLERAVKAMKAGETITLEPTTDEAVDLQLGISAIIPADYLPDVHSRLVLYKRLSNCQSDDEIDEMKVEMIDRFGALPQATENLFSLAHLKHAGATIKLKKVSCQKQRLIIEFSDNSPIEPRKLIAFLNKHPHAAMKSATRLHCPLPESETTITLTRQIIQALT